MVKIKATVKPTRQVFYNDETGFGIYAVTVDDKSKESIEYNKYGNITISGNNIPKLVNKQEYEMVIEKDEKAKFPNSYKVLAFGSEKEMTGQEQWDYLRELVTENQYDSIIDFYKPDLNEGIEIVEVIKNGEFDYNQISGFGEISYNKLYNKVMENMAMGKIMAKYSRFGMTINAVKKLLLAHGTAENVIKRVDENPYILTELDGFGFAKADELALKMGIPMESRDRIHACLFYILEESMANGNSWLNDKALLNKSIELLNISRIKIEDELKLNLNKITCHDGRYATTFVYHAEFEIAKDILRRNSLPIQKDDIDISKIVSEFEFESGVSISSEQRAFFENFGEKYVSFLIGNAGTGKSMIQKILLKYAKELNMSVLLLSPTGKAAKVSTNYTGQQAYTIHKILAMRDELYYDIILVDEASMCDVSIVYRLLMAISSDKTRVVFIGDDAQIPSVGVGNFLYDCINSGGKLHINKLTKVFRQSDGGILDIATKARHGERFVNSSYFGRRIFGKDCVLDTKHTTNMQDKIIERYKGVYDTGKWSVDDIAVLTPTNKGDLGTVELNKRIQGIVNPKSSSKDEYVSAYLDTTFRVGDYVMNRVNQYDVVIVDELGLEIQSDSSDESEPVNDVTDVFNGESGFIKSVNNDDKYIVIEIDGKFLKYDFDKLATSIMHCWAITIHKSQGSEYKVAIALVDKTATFQLNANLLYTGISRAKEYLLIMGQSATINSSLGKFANLSRQSFLKDFLFMLDTLPESERTLDNLKNMTFSP